MREFLAGVGIRRCLLLAAACSAGSYRVWRERGLVVVLLLPSIFSPPSCESLGDRRRKVKVLVAADVALFTVSSVRVQPRLTASLSMGSSRGLHCNLAWAVARPQRPRESVEVTLEEALGLSVAAAIVTSPYQIMVDFHCSRGELDLESELSNRRTGGGKAPQCPLENRAETLDTGPGAARPEPESPVTWVARESVQSPSVAPKPGGPVACRVAG